MATSGERDADESKSHNVPILSTPDSSTADSSSRATERKVSKDVDGKELHKQMRPTWPSSTTPRRAYRAKMGDVAIDVIKDREERRKMHCRDESQGIPDYNRFLPRKPEKHLRNVFTRMEDSSVGPFSLLYRSVKEKRKVKVWTRSYKFVRGICTGYLVAYDKHWNLAMSDVDEVYRNPAVKRKVRSDAKKRHKKRTKLKTSPDCGVDKEADVVQDGDVVDTERQQLEVESSKDAGTEPTLTKLASSKYPSLKDNSCSEASTSDDEDTMIVDQGRDDKSSEEQLSRLRQSDEDEEEDLDSLALRLSRLKEELGEISLTDDLLAEGPLIKVAATDEVRREAAGIKQLVTHTHKTSSSRSDESKHRASMSRDRSSRSESDRLLERDSGKKPRGSSRKKERGAHMSEGREGGSQGKETVSTPDVNVGTDCAKGCDELLERHVNQLFIRGDNVVMISVLP